MQEYKFDDKLRYEILDGKIVYMAPRPSVEHHSVADNIFWIFRGYLKGKKCRTFSDGVYVRLDKIKDITLPEKNKKDRVIPDVMIVCNPDTIKPDGIYGAPDLIVEVLSPRTAKNDKSTKKDMYESIGVREYWIVDVPSRLIEVYLLTDGKYVLDNTYHQYTKIEIEMIMDDDTIEDKTFITEFKTSLYEDLAISIDDVFDKLT